MNEKQISDARALLSPKRNGTLRKLFYQKNGLPKQGIHSNSQIFGSLGILDYDPNSLEEEGLLRILGASLAYLRKQAKEAGLAWIDVEIMRENRKIARHGFSKDIDQIMLNASKFETIAENHERIAETTRDIAAQQKRLLSA